MILRLKVRQVVSLGDNMIRLILARPSLSGRVEPIPKTQEQRLIQDLTRQIQQVFGSIYPGGIIIGGPAGTLSQSDLTVEMLVTEEEYAQMGRPGINETVQLELKRVTDDQDEEKGPYV
ncbi:MAG: hypothetical protein QXI59_01930 [Candidatus Bathyarchaeia archaeon]